jgi:hypothetical protein
MRMPGRASEPRGGAALPTSATTSPRAPAASARRAFARNVHEPRRATAMRPRAPA